MNQLTGVSDIGGEVQISDDVGYPYSVFAPDAQLKQGGADGIRIIDGGLFSGTFQVGLGYEMPPGQFKFFRCEPVVVVPLPSALWLFGSALAGLAGIKRHKIRLSVY